jgi:hypothetical protein
MGIEIKQTRPQPKQHLRIATWYTVMIAIMDTSIKVKVKISLLQAMETHRVVRG